MQIFVKNHDNKTITFELEETDTIRTLFVLMNNLKIYPLIFFILLMLVKLLDRNHLDALCYILILKKKALYMFI